QSELRLHRGEKGTCLRGCYGVEELHPILEGDFVLSDPIRVYLQFVERGCAQRSPETLDGMDAGKEPAFRNEHEPFTRGLASRQANLRVERLPSPDQERESDGLAPRCRHQCPVASRWKHETAVDLSLIHELWDQLPLSKPVSLERKLCIRGLDRDLHPAGS